MIYNPFSLQNKTILVTGASSGLGASTAIECSKVGAKVIITARNIDRLNSTFKQLQGYGHIQLPYDLSNTSNIDEIVEKLPNLDGVALCAGITKTIPVKFISKDKINETRNNAYYEKIINHQTPYRTERA